MQPCHCGYISLIVDLLCKVQDDNMPPCHCGYISLIVDLFSIKIIPLYKLYALEEIISFAILNTS